MTLTIRNVLLAENNYTKNWHLLVKRTLNFIASLDRISPLYIYIYK